MEPKLKILFGILSTHERDGWHHPSINQFFNDLAHNPDGIGWLNIPVHQFIPAAAGRNTFCHQAKDCDADWVCMIDNDMTLPGNLLDAIKNAPEDADIVCPRFYMWNETELKLVLCWGVEITKEEEAANYGIRHFDPGYHELTKCGTGVLFVRPRVFQEMQFPYFRYTYDGTGNQTGTEDIQFCLAARKKGFKIYGTTAVKVGHNKTVDLMRMSEWMDKQQKFALDMAKEAVAQ